MSDLLQLPKKKARGFIPADFKVTEWNEIEPFFNDLLNRKISSKEELEKWFLDRSELEAILSEDMAWRYIRMTCDTENEELREKYIFFVQEIQPKIAPLSHKLNETALQNSYLDQLDQTGYDIMIRGLKKEFEIFRPQAKHA